MLPRSARYPSEQSCKSGERSGTPEAHSQVGLGCGGQSSDACAIGFNEANSRTDAHDCQCMGRVKISTQGRSPQNKMLRAVPRAFIRNERRVRHWSRSVSRMRTRYCRTTSKVGYDPIHISPPSPYSYNCAARAARRTISCICSGAPFVHGKAGVRNSLSVGRCFGASGVH